MTDEEDIDEVVDDVNSLSNMLTRMQEPGPVSRAGGRLKLLTKLIAPLALAAAGFWVYRAGMVLQSVGRNRVLAGLTVVVLVLYAVLFHGSEDDSWTAGPGERFEV